jgi:hypothetical protein
MLEFLNRYISKSGYRSGWKGFYYSFMMAAYRMTQAIKIREMQMGLDDGASEGRYQRIAEEIAGQYELVQERLR